MTKKVLIVDDDPVWRQIAHQTLKAENYEPLVATDVISALTATQKHQPNLILLDLGLPAGGGQTFLKRLRTFPALTVIPVIVISGLDETQGMATAADPGIAGYLKKPVSREALIAAIRKVVE